MPSPDNSVIIAGSPSAILDSVGNVWTIAPTATVQINGRAAGYTAGATQLAFVAGKIWHMNLMGTWYLWTGGGWQLGANPLPTSEVLLLQILATLKGILDMSTSIATDVSNLTTDTGALTAAVTSLSAAVTGLIAAFQGATNLTPAQQTAIQAADAAVKQASTDLAADTAAIGAAEAPPAAAPAAPATTPPPA